jgi:hypothetical protein
VADWLGEQQAKAICCAPSARTGKVKSNDARIVGPFGEPP